MTDDDGRPRISVSQRGRSSGGTGGGGATTSRLSLRSTHSPTKTNTKTTTGILKKTSLIDVREELERALAAESPERWFQRILRSHGLSPLDLCDRLCYGESNKHRLVPLRHICEVLYDLDPTGDPLTEEMEEFLYRFSFDPGDGEIVIDVKDALRTLDIWPTRSGPTSPSRGLKNGPETFENSPAKATMLEVKSERLKTLIASLQDENLRLSQTIAQGRHRHSGDDDPADNHEDDAAMTTTMDAPAPLKIAIKGVGPQASAARSLSLSRASSSPLSSRSPTKMAPTKPDGVVNRHEKELAEIAARLEYSGVKRLEELLTEADKGATGFVSLKQVRWFLSHEFGVDLTEVQLMELCLGMNFNPQGQIDHKELIYVMLDFLLYGPEQPASQPGQLRAPRLNEVDAAAIVKIREYLRGFHGQRERNRGLLELLCDKYDLEGNQSLALAEMTRVFVQDLPNQHPVKLKFPLVTAELRRFLQSVAAASVRQRATSPRHGDRSARAVDATSNDDGGSQTFIYYPDVLDVLFDVDAGPSGTSSPVLARVLQPEFWDELRRGLCPHTNDLVSERKIHQQLCKILLKLDGRRTFGISARHFHKIFDQHWSLRDLETLVDALSHAPPTHRHSRPREAGAGAPVVRYDVLMKILFGAPELRDEAVVGAIARKLQANSAIQERLLTALATHGRQHRVSYARVRELLESKVDEQLTITELLFVIALLTHPHERSVELQRLCDFVHGVKATASHRPKSPRGPGPQSTSRPSPQSAAFDTLREYLRGLCTEHDLIGILERAARHEPLIVAVDDAVEAIAAQVRGLRIPREDRAHVSLDAIRRFLDAVAHEGDGHGAVDQGGTLLRLEVLLEALVSWRAMARAFRLPAGLLEAKRTLELLDWERDGTVDVDDWHKAWRQLASKEPFLADWETRVLLAKFGATRAPSPSRRRTSSSSMSRREFRPRLEYARLLMFLLDHQQRVARDRLQTWTLEVFCRKCLEARAASSAGTLTTRQLERLFEEVDRDGKGYFNAADLRAFLQREAQGLHRSDEREEMRHLLSTTTGGGGDGVVEEVLLHLQGNRRPPSKQQKVVTLMRFQELVNHEFARPLTAIPSDNGDHRHAHAPPEDQTSDDYDDEHEGPSPRGRDPVHIKTLRELEQVIAEIAEGFVDAQGHVSPALAYEHFTGTQRRPPRRSRSQSPVRSMGSGARAPPRSSLASSSRPSTASSSPSRRRSMGLATSPRRQLDGASLSVDPLTVAQLKRTLREHHGIEVPTHLLTQYFLHLGSENRHFLEPQVFARWLAPISVDLQMRVRQVVKEMLARSKSGGGQVDLTRFLQVLQRRLHEATSVGGSYPPGCQAAWEDHHFADTGRVRPGLLLHTLHQLNVPLRKPEMTQLLRHFGMENQDDVDYKRFIERLYELTLVKSNG